MLNRNNIDFFLKNGSVSKCPIYTDGIVSLISKLSKQNYKPISTYDIIEQRIKFPLIDKSDLSCRWWTNWFNSGDSIRFHPDGRIKIVYDSQTLININPKSSLDKQGALILPYGTFDKFEGVEFSEKEVEKFNDKSFMFDEIYKNQFWLSLVKEDKSLLKEYIWQMCSRIEKLKLMKIHIAKPNLEFEVERPLCIFGTKGNGNINMDRLDRNIRMIGIKK